MAPLPLESRAYRRTLGAVVLTFIIGSVFAIACGLYLLISFVTRGSSWWGIVEGVRLVFIFPFFIALGAAAAVGQIMDWRYYRLGEYRCPHCRRALRARNAFCVCQQNDPLVRRARAARARRKHQRFRHVRRQIVPVLVAYALLTIPACLLAAVAPGLRRGPLLWNAVVGHALLCLLVAALARVALLGLEQAGLARRLRLRAVVFLRLFLIWPLLVVVAFVFR